MKKFTLFLLVSFFIYSSHLQAIQITQLNVFPQNPTTNDFITFSVDVMASTSPCQPILIDSTHSGNQINFNVQHETGMLMVICIRNDTYNLGQLPAGNYTLNHRVYQLGGIDDDLTVSFTVTDAGGTPSPEFDFSAISSQQYCIGDTIEFEAIAKNFDSMNAFSVNLIRQSDGQSQAVPANISNQDSLWSFSVPVNGNYVDAGEAYAVEVQSSSPALIFTDTSVFMIKDIPNAPEWISLNTSFCESDSIGEFYFTIENADYILNWQANPASAIDNLTIENNAVQVETQEEFTGSFELFLYNSNVCGNSGYSDSLEIVIHENPEVYIVDSGDNIFTVSETGNVNWFVNETPAIENPTMELDLTPYITLDSIYLKAEFTNVNGCHDTDEILIFFNSVQAEVSIEEKVQIHFENGALIIENGYNRTIQKVNFFNVSGQKLFEYTSIKPDEKIDMTSQHSKLSGVYIVEFIIDSQRFHKKVYAH